MPQTKKLKLFKEEKERRKNTFTLKPGQQVRCLTLA